MVVVVCRFSYTRLPAILPMTIPYVVAKRLPAVLLQVLILSSPPVAFSF